MNEELELLRRIAERASQYFRAKGDYNYAHKREVGGVKGCHDRLHAAVTDWENYMSVKNN
jgi:hypothetical protein